MWKLIQGGNEAVLPVMLQGPFLVCAGCSHTVEPGNCLFHLWSCRIFSSFHLTEECCMFYLKEGISLTCMHFSRVNAIAMNLIFFFYFMIL